ncbi:hypothetical protein CLOSTHATH_04915 [Hungatella hathewayi DSM 13479]|uniref:Uncharacterized protein n=1 Tax=Hungatella hathewayi DSM 13479 TaxID=566550 RepID=D3AMR5_9FIRM|nr:hypothetical protein CLOSTHATH_04915 [Hungatella hathewayi DSM 13479]
MNSSPLRRQTALRISIVMYFSVILWYYFLYFHCFFSYQNKVIKSKNTLRKVLSHVKYN